MATMTRADLPLDFPVDLAARLTSCLACLADYRDAIARGRDLDRRHGGMGRYVDDMRADTAGSYRRSMMGAVREIREFVALAREIEENPSAILRALESTRRA